MSDRRIFRWASTSARLLVGTVVAVGAVVAVVTAISIPWPTLAREPVSVVATPSPGSTVLSCDGGLLVLGGDLENAGAVSLAVPQSVVAGGSPDAPASESLVLAADDVSGGVGPEAFTAPPASGERTDLAASGSATADTDGLAGFAASACRPPLMESWLVAGSAATGSADFVLLSNPGSVAATVQLTLFGATGPVAPPGGSDLIVPAGTQRVVPLAGLARGESSPVIRVNSVGAPVQAAVQSSITRVLEPGGVDQSGVVTSTSNTQRIVGVSVTQAPGAEGATSASTVLRVLSPGADAEATVTVRSIGTAQEPIEPVVVQLAAGVPTEVGLNGLPVGEYVIDIGATAPIVSGVWQATGFDAGSDFAWHSPSPEIGVPTLFAVPAGPSATLSLANPGTDPVTVTVTDADGSRAVEVTVPPGGSTTLPLSQSTVHRLDSAGVPVQAAVTMEGAGALAAFSIWPADAAAPPIEVFP
ncbi:MAG: DUF5719 family protein [Microbacterium sp.]